MDYFGNHLTMRECELKAMRIDPAHREGEADLLRTRWFDYALLHAAHATYLYAHFYKEYTKDFNASYLDIRTSEDANAFTPDDIFMSRDLTSMWLARRSADALGIPYEFIMNFAKHRALGRLSMRFPRPNQLYGEEFEIDLKAAWSEALATSLRYSRHNEFRVSSRRGKSGSVLQKKHGIFVVEQIKKRGSKVSHSHLLARMFCEGILDEQMTREHFDEDIILNAKANAVKLELSHH